jgi:hypothetical protein
LTKIIRNVSLPLFMLILVFSSWGQLRAEEFWKEADEKNTIVNTKALALDRDGRKTVLTDCFDSFQTTYFILSSGSEGQSPIYRIDKKEVISIEFDGYYTNMSGYEYIGADVKLKNNLQKKGFFEVAHMGNLAARTFNGTSDVGKCLISWKRLKKIEFIGEWKTISIENIEEKSEGGQNGQDKQ